MPKFEPKIIQKDLESGKLWPVYWIYGGEAMKSRELLKRIRRTVLGLKEDDKSDAKESSFASAFSETVLDAQECDVGTVLDAAESLALGGGTKFVIVKQAHLLKQPEALERALGKPGNLGELSSVMVLLSKDLDQRKKFSKILIEKAAVVECAEIEDQDREPWIQYLAKRKGFTLSEREVNLLRVMDPWSLDSVDRELEKLGLADSSERDSILLGGVEAAGGDQFIEAFFARNKAEALSQVGRFSEQPEIALPLLGLLSWNVRMLALVLKDKVAGTRDAKLGSFMQEKFSRFSRLWTLDEMAALQESLRHIDFTVKQTSRLAIGAWSELVIRFCR